ncbi:MAG: hypothetical protein WA116_05700 [Anaerolineaceae bacterium]
MFLKRLRYELRAAFGISSLLPLPALAGFALLEWLIWQDSSVDSMSALVTRDFALLLPLISGLSVAHLMSVDQDEGFGELRHSYTEPLYQQALWRTLIAFLLTGVAFGLGWVAYSLAIGAPVPLQWILPALPPTLYMMGLSLLTNHLSGSYWTAAGVTLVYWFLEMWPQTRGKLTGGLFLFNAVWKTNVDETWNTILLCLVGCLFLAINALLEKRPACRPHVWNRVEHE